MASIDYQLIEQPQQLQSFCDELHAMPWIAFDTEFVSEYSYVPQLCLIQVATPGGLALIDCQRVRDQRPFWECLVAGEHETIVHAGREELRFCYRATRRVPAQWFDVQLAAGFVATDYPASYARLVQRWLNRPAAKGETRTDWRRRPLTKAQVDYALSDVLHLAELRDVLLQELQQRGRAAWFQEESTIRIHRQGPGAPSDGWRKLAGATSLTPRGRLILEQLWAWREETAEVKNCSPRRVLRDDLLVEIARRGHHDPERIMAIRGMRRDQQQAAGEMGRRVQLAKEARLPDDPGTSQIPLPPELDAIAQFLNVFVGICCRENAIASVLVATLQDIKDFVLKELEPDSSGPCPLQVGWRRSLIGQLLSDVLAGQVAVRVGDPSSPHPLDLVRLTGGPNR